MASTFTWLDYDEQQRSRMREIVGLFQDAGTVDELGLGRVRDVFSDRLFPGTSVLWRRARYLLLVPWTYAVLDREGVTGGVTAERAARRIQRRVRDALYDARDFD